MAAAKGHIEVCQLIMDNIKDKNPMYTSKLSGSPLHHAAAEGHLDVCQLILNAIKGKCCKNRPHPTTGCTPLHLAAKNGHLEICRLIMDQVDDKNPEDKDNLTPLHFSAHSGHLEVCNLILNSLDLKKDILATDSLIGSTIWFAAQSEEGRIEVCRFLMQYMEDKNPDIHEDDDPLLFKAVREGHLDLCRLIIDNIEEKNLRNDSS